MLEVRKCRGFCCRMSAADALFMFYVLLLLTVLQWV
jgi:hypothetical protein